MRLFLLILALAFTLSSCTSISENISELNERIKGDGVPYIPGL